MGTCLNIGGGSQRIAGFLNVDLCENADIKHDLREPLPFEDKSVDEIIAIHVIESFNQWELPDILKDWRRVLTGKLTIEFTDLDQTIKLYLSDSPERHTSGYWGLYGNQSVKIDPIVLHHFVWRTNDLIELLNKTGFSVEISRENIAHNPERDLRLICL
jgi:predicted SAM-dependent methyltransferase